MKHDDGNSRSERRRAPPATTTLGSRTTSSIATATARRNDERRRSSSSSRTYVSRANGASSADRASDDGDRRRRRRRPHPTTTTTTTTTTTGTAASGVVASFQRAWSETLDRTVNSIVGGGNTKKDKDDARGDEQQRSHQNGGSFHDDRTASRRSHRSPSRSRSQKPQQRFDETFRRSKRSERARRWRNVATFLVLWLPVTFVVFARPWKHQHGKMSYADPYIDRYAADRVNHNGTETSSGVVATAAAATEPSYLRLCRAVLERTESTSGGNSRERSVIREDPSVCVDDRPYGSLLRIYASALVARSAEGLGLEYEHGCHDHHDRLRQWSSQRLRRRKEGQDKEKKGDGIGGEDEDDERPEHERERDVDDLFTTVQQTLPASSSQLLSGRPVDLDETTEACRRCVRTHELHRRTNLFAKAPGPECLLFPHYDDDEQHHATDRELKKGGKTTNTRLFEQILPSLLKQIHETAHMRRMHKESSTNNDELTQQRNEEHKNKTTFRIDPDEPDDAVVWIACARETTPRRRADKDGTADDDEKNNKNRHESEDCLSYAVPHFAYVQEIPATVRSVTILASEFCATRSAACAKYGADLQTFLTRAYPRAEVAFAVADPSSAASWSSVVSAKHSVCVASESCVLPTLATDGYGVLIEMSGADHEQHQHRHELYPWLSGIPTSMRGDFVRVLRVPTIPLSDLTPDFLTKNPASRVESCRALRGRVGHWEQDLVDYAPKAQYKLPMEGYAGAADVNFQPTAEELYRPPTTYKWVEDAFPLCDVDLLNLDSLCASLDVMGIDRVFFLGDSLTLQQVQSLWKLLGFLDNHASDRAHAAARRVECPAPYGTAVEIVFARNDRLMDVTKGPVATGDRNCHYGYCWPFRDIYLNSTNTGRTLLVANTGAHSHDHHVFRHDLDAFVDMIDEWDRPDDVVWFRTSVPGHRGCDQSEASAPFATYAEYVPTITEVYSWDKFVAYNDYAARVLSRRDRTDHPGAPIGLLDVYPMTVLRRDGHAGGVDCVGCGRDDCLHYSLPGPIDWWNHLLLSHLIDTASEEKRRRRRRRGRRRGRRRT